VESDSQFTDYATLRRSAGDREAVQEEPDLAESLNRRPAQVDDVRKESASLSKEVSPKDGFLNTSFPSFTKRGHGISFAGLFLFTAVVYFRPYELSQALRWSSTSAFWIALFTAIVFIPTQLGLEGRITVRPREVNFVLLLVLCALLSIPLATNRQVAWDEFTEYLKVVLMFVVMVNVVRTKIRLKSLILLCLAASVVFSISAISDYNAGRLIVGGERIEGLVGGMFQNPNDLALHLVTMVPLAAALVFSSRNVFGRLLYISVGLAMIGGIVVTFSRGGFLGLAISTAVMVAKLTRGRKLIFALVVVVILGGLLAATPGAYRGRLSLTDDMSATNRQDDLKRSIFLTLRHPIFGLGMNNFKLFSNQGLATHNAYTQVSSELGIPAAIFYVLFLVVPLKQLRRIQVETQTGKRKPYFYYYAIGMQASLIGYMVSSFFASVAFLWYAYYLVGYALCLRFLYEAQNTKKAEDAPVGVLVR